MGRAEDARNLMLGSLGIDTLILRVADASAVSSTSFGRWTVYEDLGLWTRDIEDVVIVEGTDLTGETFYDDRFAAADLWNFV